MFRSAVIGLLASLLLLSFPAAACNGRVTVVYWSAGDCSWCQRWERDPAMAPAFRKSPLFSRIDFRTVTKSRLSLPFVATDYPGELNWLQQRVVAGEIKTPRVVPAWSVFVDRRLIDSYYGTQAWLSRATNDIELLLKEVCPS